MLLVDEKKFALEFILALLNSKLYDFVYKNIAGEEGRAFAQVKGVNLAKLPIKKNT